ncbi:MAG: nucleotidyl transferase AbiEii/AbiGii toxin family protein [Prevotellaceae bacterium]|jgi:predicted nucleotidyltransferase component of viral defense system|nr:nucleotidyl transferase AbiEii/AbiGii toxin family protein [Prevotellaceae bacterium]
MINQKDITVEWLIQVSKKYRNIDKILVEKVIRALLLLEGLAKQNIDFVFKGGTALMLLLDSTKRLSLDIDIILPQRIENFEMILNNIAKSQGFSRVELQQRIVQSKMKKEHYKFFFTPLHKSNKDEEYVLLDVLHEKINYKHLNSTPIQSVFIPTIDKPLSVNIPSLDDILGDKLTAFAPNTTGIPYYKHGDSMSMEIIKQLYDIGNIIDVITDIETVKNTFYNFVQAELAYSNTGQTPEDVLNDIYQTALCLVTRGSAGNGNFNELQKGIRRIKNLIFSESYYIEKVITHAAKVAYVATLIRHNAISLDKFDNLQQLKDWTIGSPLNTKLNKLKKSNPEAFFYWYKIYELENNN